MVCPARPLTDVDPTLQSSSIEVAAPWTYNMIIPLWKLFSAKIKRQRSPDSHSIPDALEKKSEVQRSIKALKLLNNRLDRRPTREA